MKIPVKESASEEYLISKSKFIGFVIPGDLKKLFLDRIRELQMDHHSANHIAFAYRIKTANGIDDYFNDAGEPSGTAGRPLLNILQNQNLINTCLAVVRYYGGVNLGTGGLARAYSKAAMMAIDQADFKDFIKLNYYKIILEYNMLDNLTDKLLKENAEIIDKHFEENIVLKVKMTESAFKNIQSQFSLIKITPI
ncbi:MAG: YigZ family protein [Methylophilaceae bacterium]